MYSVGLRKAAILAISALALILGACVRHADLPVASGAPAGQQMPFRTNTDESGDSPTASLVQQVPAGTVLQVRLTSAFSSASARAGDRFEAVLEAPVMAGEVTLLPSGAAIEGRVLATGASQLPDVPGYLRLTLTTVSVSGKLLPLQTSTYFTKGGPRRRHNPSLAGASVAPEAAKLEVELSGGQSLSFRLAQVFSVPN